MRRTQHAGGMHIEVRVVLAYHEADTVLQDEGFWVPASIKDLFAILYFLLQNATMPPIVPTNRVENGSMIQMLKGN